MSDPNADTLYNRIRNAASQAGVPFDIAQRLFYMESGMSHTTLNSAGQNVVKVGDNGASFGIGQVSRAVGTMYGLDVEDEQQNIQAALRYLRDNYNRFGQNWGLAYAAYNAGPEKVAGAGNQPPPGYPQERIDFILGKSGTTVNGWTVGQGGVPEAASTSSGNPAQDVADAIKNLPANIQSGITSGIQGMIDKVGKQIADGLNEAGIRTSNQFANWWNAQGPAILFYAVGIIFLLIGLALLASKTTTVGITPAGPVVLPKMGGGIKPVTQRRLAIAESRETRLTALQAAKTRTVEMANERSARKSDVARLANENRAKIKSIASADVVKRG